MFICNRCGHTFQEPKYIKNGGGDIGEDWPVCPECYDDNTEAARRCELCERIKSDEDMCVHVDVCISCMAEVSKRAKEVLQSSFPAAEFKAISEYYDMHDPIV